MSDWLELRDLPKGYVSHSQINMYKRCPMQYYFRYEEGLKIPPKGALIVGKSVHKGLEVDWSQKIESNENLPTEQVIEVFSDEFEKTCTEVKNEVSEIDWGKEQVKGKNWVKREKGKVKDGAVKSLSTYHKTKAIYVFPVDVEKPFEIELKGLDIKLVGRTDCKHLLKKKYIIKDIKTTSRYNASKLLPDQLIAYQIANPDVDSLELDVIHLTMNKCIPEPYDKAKPEQIEVYLNTLKEVVKSIRSQIYYPNPGFNATNCSMCGYKEKHCKLWRKYDK